MNPLENVINLFAKKRPPVHELKWKIPETRLTAPVKDAEDDIAILRKHSRFITGGEYVDTVYYKEYGENVNAYFIVRVDNKTQQENLLFDGYMIQEDEKLTLEVASAYSIQPYLEKLGYKKGFERSVTIWQFTAGIINVTVYSVDDFGDFVEVALPPTKFVKAREAAERFAYNLFDKIGVKKEEIIPTDVNTLELIQSKESEKSDGKSLF